MNSKQSDTLSMYVNDMLAVEKDIFNAVDSQAKDETVAKAGVSALVRQIAADSGARVQALEALTKTRENKIGAAVKGAIATAAGTLAGLYDKVRQHPVSRSLRDDYVALSLAAVAYSMLYTTAVAFEDDEVADVALNSLSQITGQVKKLGSAIPSVVVHELKDEGPVYAEAEGIASEAVASAWN